MFTYKDNRSNIGEQYIYYLFTFISQSPKTLQQAYNTYVLLVEKHGMHA
jgi:hypothetical protein